MAWKLGNALQANLGAFTAVCPRQPFMSPWRGDGRRPHVNHVPRARHDVRRPQAASTRLPRATSRHVNPHMARTIVITATFAPPVPARHLLRPDHAPQPPPALPPPPAISAAATAPTAVHRFRLAPRHTRVGRCPHTTRRIRTRVHSGPTADAYRHTNPCIACLCGPHGRRAACAVAIQ